MGEYRVSSGMFRSQGIGAMRYARNYAGRVAADLHRCGHPGAQIEMVNDRYVGRQFPVRMADFIVHHPDVSDDEIREVMQADLIVTDKLPIELYTYGLKDWYAFNWVSARRLLAIAYVIGAPEDSKELSNVAGMMFDRIDVQAFSCDLDKSVTVFGIQYGRFWCGDEYFDGYCRSHVDELRFDVRLLDNL